MIDSSPCLHCGGPAKHTFCGGCLPPQGEWGDKKAYSRRYNELYALAGKHPDWKLWCDLPSGHPALPVSELHRYHPARAPECPYPGCTKRVETRRSRAKDADGSVWQKFRPYCVNCTARRNWRKRNGLDPDTGSVRDSTVKNHNGYTVVSAPDHPRSSASGMILQHRLVMEQKLGRYLEPHENVHHKNGRRNDNRPENLELWAVPQPSGQRVTDLVAWVVGEYPDLCIELLAVELSTAIPTNPVQFQDRA